MRKLLAYGFFEGARLAVSTPLSWSGLSFPACLLLCGEIATIFLDLLNDCGSSPQGAVFFFHIV
jgi:hypothetical protein